MDQEGKSKFLQAMSYILNIFRCRVILLALICPFQLFAQTGISLTGEFGNAISISPVPLGSGSVVLSSYYSYMEGFGVERLNSASDLSICIGFGVSDMLDAFISYRPEFISSNLSATGRFGLKLWLAGRRRFDSGLAIRLGGGTGVDSLGGRKNFYEFRFIASHPVFRIVNLFLNAGFDMFGRNPSALASFGLDVPVSKFSIILIDFGRFDERIYGYSQVGFIGVKIFSGLLQIHTGFALVNFKDRWNKMFTFGISISSQKFQIWRRFERMRKGRKILPPPLKKKKREG
jgi:hypothetical protein